MNHEKFEELLRDIKYYADKFQQKTCDALMNRVFFWSMFVSIIVLAIR